MEYLEYCQSHGLTQRSRKQGLPGLVRVHIELGTLLGQGVPVVQYGYGKEIIL